MVKTMKNVFKFLPSMNIWFIWSTQPQNHEIDAQRILMKPYSIYPIPRNHLLHGRFVCRSAPPSVGVQGCYWRPLHTEALPSILWQSGGRRLLLLTHTCLFHPQIHCNRHMKKEDHLRHAITIKQNLVKEVKLYMLLALCLLKKNSSISTSI